MREKSLRDGRVRRKKTSPSARKARKEEYYQYERRPRRSRKRSSSWLGKFFIFLLLIAAALALITLYLRTRQPKDVALVENTESADQDLSVSEEEPEDEAPHTLMPADYPHNLAGGLSKGELEFVLSYVPDPILKDGPTSKTIGNTLSRMISGDIMNETNLFGRQKAHAYSLTDLQRFLDSFSDWSLKENGGPYNIQGDTLSMKADSLGILASANITDAKISRDKLEISYELDYMGGDPDQKKPYHAEKKAILWRSPGGLFQIEEIVEGKKTEIHPANPQQSEDQMHSPKDHDNDNGSQSQVKMAPPGHVSNKGKNAKTQQQKAYQMSRGDQSKNQNGQGQGIVQGQDQGQGQAQGQSQGIVQGQDQGPGMVQGKAIYRTREKAVAGVLANIKSDRQKYQIPVDSPAQRTGDCHYASADLDGDGIEELLVEADAQDGNHLKRFVQIYQINKKGEGQYQPLLLQGYFSAIRLCLPRDGKGGIYLLDSATRSSERALYRTTLSQGRIITPGQPEQILMEDSPEMAEFLNSVQEIRWKKVK